jgi:type II secretory pathway component GspD/PulD (secretin)
VGRPPEPAVDEPPHVIRLKHARVQEVLQVLEQLYGRMPGSRVAGEPRTNSLIVIAPDKQLVTIVQLVKELDVEAPERTK